MPQGKTYYEQIMEMQTRRDSGEIGSWSAEALLLRNQQLTLSLSVLVERVGNPWRRSAAWLSTPAFLELHRSHLWTRWYEAGLGAGKTEQVWTADQLADATGVVYGLRIAAEESRQAAAEARDAAAAAQAATAELSAIRRPSGTLAHLAGRFEGNPLWTEMEEAAGASGSEADAE